jgi:CP family cyanate transporter-like MFS transporter
VGYLIASCGPFIAGSLLHATGSLNSLAMLCVAVCAVSAWFGYAAGRREHVNAQLHTETTTP